MYKAFEKTRNSFKRQKANALPNGISSSLFEQINLIQVRVKVSSFPKKKNFINFTYKYLVWQSLFLLKLICNLNSSKLLLNSWNDFSHKQSELLEKCEKMK